MEDINRAIKEEIFEYFKTTNKITDTENDVIYIMYVDKAVQTILNLTNRIIFPEPLKYVVLDLINDFYNVDKSKNNETPLSNTSDITSMSEAGRSISFGNQSSTFYSTLVSKHIDEQLEMRRNEIYRYRLLYREVLKTDGQD